MQLCFSYALLLNLSIYVQSSCVNWFPSLVWFSYVLQIVPVANMTQKRKKLLLIGLFPPLRYKHCYNFNGTIICLVCFQISKTKELLPLTLKDFQTNVFVCCILQPTYSNDVALTLNCGGANVILIADIYTYFSYYHFK